MNDLTLKIYSPDDWNVAWSQHEPSTWNSVPTPCITDTSHKYSPVWLKTDLINHSRSSQLFLTHIDQPVTVYADDKSIFSRNDQTISPRFEGYTSLLIEIPPNTKTLKFKLVPTNQTHQGLCGRVEIGPSTSMPSHLFSEGLSHLLIPMVYLFSGAMLTPLLFKWLDAVSFRKLVFFLLALGTWLLSIPQNFLKDFLLPSPAFWIFLDQTSLYLLASVLISFLESLFPKKIWGVLRWCKYGYLVLAGVAPFLHFTNQVTFIDTNVFFNRTILPFLILMIFNVLAIARNSSREGVFLASSMIAFLILGIHDWLVGIWVLPSQPLLLGYGFFMIASTFAYLAIRQLQMFEAKQSKLKNEHALFKRIAQATQMVAHDVGRPFSMLRSAIDIIRNSKTSDQVMARATSLIQDVEDSLNKVDNLIGDIIAISNHKPLKTVPEKPEKLIEDVIRDTLRQHPEAQVDFEFSFCHNKHIAIDPNKIRRVVSNILANAFQAMGNQGVVSISTNHKWVGRSEFVEISIHNSGPPIAAVDLPHVFDSFFTKGKQGGTGLGLATAKTFIEAHGGQITCESSETQGVRFTFSLEAVGETYSPQIPSITPETLICEAKTVLSTKSNGGISRENHFNQKIFNILIVEDEPIFQQGLLDEIHRFKSDDYEIITTLAHSADDAHKCIAKTPPDLILLDIDLGPDSVDGLQFLREIRSQGIKTFVCIHSNRTFFGAGVTPADLGADVALPKPLNAKNLEFIIGEAHKKGMCESNRPKVIVVDDEECYLTAWKEAMTDAEVIGFLDPEVFWDQIMEKPDVLHSLSCIIFDFFFRGSDMDKLQLVRSLRSKGFGGPIILSTNAPYDNHHNSPKSRFNLVIKKRAMAFSELKAIPEVAITLRNTITPNTKGKPPWLPD
jgi:signal transduction histidine kinase/DNA-binding response OmpR family regulator